MASEPTDMSKEKSNQNAFSFPALSSALLLLASSAGHGCHSQPVAGLIRTQGMSSVASPKGRADGTGRDVNAQRQAGDS